METFTIIITVVLDWFIVGMLLAMAFTTPDRLKDLKLGYKIVILPTYLFDRLLDTNFTFLYKKGDDCD